MVVGRAHGSRLADFFQIPTTDYLFDIINTYSRFNLIGLFLCHFDHLPCFWLICIRIPCQIWGNFCKLFYLPLASFQRFFDSCRSFEIRSNCFYVLRVILDCYNIFGERANCHLV